MRTADFDFQLPPELIAQEAGARGESRLLVLPAGGPLSHRRFADLPELLEPGDLLVVNDTRVIPARVWGRRSGASGEGGRIELLLLEEVDAHSWWALCRPGKKCRPGSSIALEGGASLEVIEVQPDGRRLVRADQPLLPLLERIGHVPLPPYIARADQEEDRERYQTVWARQAGAVAAPTAGLHFSPALLAELAARGVGRAAITLHVGIGTFKPVKVDEIADHVMDAERFEVPAATAAAIAQTRARGGRVVAVGTTVTRTLESVARENGGEVAPGSGRTALFITPGFPFQVVDRLITNFHLPRSTLLMLAAAFAGDRQRLLDAYAAAIAERYRFYSYGDAMLLDRP